MTNKELRLKCLLEAADLLRDIEVLDETTYENYKERYIILKSHSNILNKIICDKSIDDVTKLEHVLAHLKNNLYTIDEYDRLCNIRKNVKYRSFMITNKSKIVSKINITQNTKSKNKSSR